MAFEHSNARTVFPSGIRHANVPQTSHFTVIGNHLTQHRTLSLTAIGLAAHIQSVPSGTRITIRLLAEQFPEGEVRIAEALRELEGAGYLSRKREKLPSGQIITRTVSYNQPGAVAAVPDPEDPPPPPARPRRPKLAEAPTPPPAAPAPEPAPPAVPPRASAPTPPLPAPSGDAHPARRAAAVALLAGLRRVNHRLLLGERDIHRLAGGVEAWLERGASPDAVTAALTHDLPVPTLNPAGLIAYRLAVQLPPILGPLHRSPAFVRPDPVQNCQACDRGFRGPTPGRCEFCVEQGRPAA